jgi:hypothetical protein
MLCAVLLAAASSITHIWMLDSFIRDQFTIRSISGGEQRRRAEFFLNLCLLQQTASC